MQEKQNLKKGDKVKVHNAFGDWFGKVKYIFDNPNGPAQVGIIINESQNLVYYGIDKVVKLEEVEA